MWLEMSNVSKWVITDALSLIIIIKRRNVADEGVEREKEMMKLAQR